MITGGVPMRVIKKILTAKSGQAVVEYGFILLLVALVVMTALFLIGTSLLEFFQDFLQTIQQSI